MFQQWGFHREREREREREIEKRDEPREEKEIVGMALYGAKKFENVEHLIQEEPLMWELGLRTHGGHGVGEASERKRINI